ncbi:hypothetical protein ABVK25_010646 [Lepraria finkii]|uniref:Gamma-glutamylcyclotransferase AIG2-like domain-containing protein n=1 Tax=Lepraria finkii TaxID=1340010 RepID=A0ABR4AU98_9LECA
MIFSSSPERRMMHLVLVLILFFCKLVLPASLPPPSSFMLSNMDANLTLPANSTSPNILAPDPYYYDILSPFRIKFYSYGSNLNEEGVINVIRDAHDDAATHDMNSPMNVTEIGFSDYEYGVINLILRPQRHMTWIQWEDTTLALHIFIEMFVAVELRFDVEVAGGGVIGTGTLARGVLAV